MLISEILLLILSLLVIVFSPLYLYSRSKMTQNKKPHTYSKRTIFRVISMHFCVLFVFTVIHAAILQSLLTGTQGLSQRTMFQVSLQVLFLAALLYGSGIYITAILFETFVAKKYLVIRYLHGILSHTIIFVCSCAAFANLSLLSHQLEIQTTTDYWIPFIILGALCGVVLTVDNIANGILLLSTIAGYIGIFLFLYVNPEVNSFSQFFLGFITSFCICATTAVLYRFIKYKRVLWYEPINIF